MRVIVELNLSKASKKKLKTFSKLCTKKRVFSVVLTLGLVTSIAAYTANITKLYTFGSGTSISASQVNSNFDQIITELNAKDARITKFENNIFPSSGGNVGIGTQSPLGALDVGTGQICQNGACSASSIGTNGYQKFPGGLIIQWGAVAGTGTSVTYPIAFSTAVYSITATGYGSSGNALNGILIMNPTTTGFGYDSSWGSNKPSNMYWMAIGK